MFKIGFPAVFEYRIIMKKLFGLFTLVYLFTLLSIIPCFGIAPIEIPALVFGQAGDFVLIGTDPNEMPTEPNINQVFVKSDVSKLYFKITSYKNFGNDAFFWIDMDTDQNVNTGSNVFGIGTDCSVEIYLEGGKAYGSLMVYDKNQDEWNIVDASFDDVIFSPNGNILQFSLKRSDLGNPKAFNFQVVFFISMDVIDLAPDDKYYTYKLDEGQTQPGGNPSIVASPTTVKPGDKITVTYTNAPGNATDWIGMYKVSAGEGRTWETYQYLNGNKNGTLTFVAPNTEGSYNFRMYPKDAYEPRLAVSNTVVVSSAAQPGGNETALQKAMAWLAKQQNADGSFCGSSVLGATAMAVQAFEEKGHLPGKGQQYSSIVEKGLDYIFSKAVLENISAQKAGNPDSNGNNKGVYFQVENKYAYETGLCISAILASKDPNRVVNTGPCKGWTYAQVMRDVVDYFAFAQDETKGGWRYTPNQQDSDNSVTQWPVFGMLYIGQWGIAAPGWVNSELNRWIGLVQNDDGSSGYTSKTDPLDSSPWTTMGKTGGLLIEMYYLGDKANSPRVQKAISYLDNKDRWNTKGKENSYAMFSIYKGLRLMSIKSLPNAVPGGDWYNDYVQLILKNQKAEGYWEDYYGTCLPTAWYIMMLEDVVKPIPTITTQNPNITLPADGQSNTGITVSVNDPQGKPLPGQTLTATVNPPNGGTMGPIIDNGNGTYTGTFTAGNTPGQVTITITVVNINISINISITLIVPGTGATTTITQAPPASMPADGRSSTNITITIKNPQGQPLPGQNVTVTVNPPGAITVGPIKDNGNGTYTIPITAGNTPGNVTITINVPGGQPTNININMTPPGAGGRMLIIPEVTGSPGKPVTVPINITDTTNVAGADINVLYDANILTITEIKQTAISSGMNLVQNTGNRGKIILRLAQTTALGAGSGALVEMIFNIGANVTIGTETPVTFESAEVFDGNALTMIFGTQNGKVKIVSDCVKGDVNGDGAIKSNDAILTLRISAGLMNPNAREFCAADYNSDNSVKSNDAILILRKSAGLIAPEKEITGNDRYITVSFDEVYGEAGQTITVPLRVDNPKALAGGDLWISYNSSVLRAISVLPENDILLAGNISEPGKIRIAFAASEKLNNETIANIKFDVIANQVSPLEIQNYELYDYSGVLLSSVVKDKSFISYYSKPKYSALLQNFPNPFNPDTWIPYQIIEDSDITIWILNAKGETVRKLELGHKPAGLYLTHGRAAYWDGKDDSGNPVASGVYFYSIKAGELSAVKKMIIMK